MLIDRQRKIHQNLCSFTKRFNLTIPYEKSVLSIKSMISCYVFDSNVFGFLSLTNLAYFFDFNLKSLNS